MWNFMTPAQNAAYDRWESTWCNGPNDEYDEEPPLEDQDHIFDCIVILNEQDLHDITEALIAADYPESYIRLYTNAKPDQDLTLDNVDLHIAIDVLREHSPNNELADALEEALDETREEYLKDQAYKNHLYS